MERSVAIKKLTKILGKSLGYRVDPEAPKQEERDAARAELLVARKERDALNEKREARLQAILAADPEYQALKADAQAAKERTDRLGSISRHYKITVGTTSSMFFSVAAEGDTWEEVIEKLTKEKVRA